MSVLSETYQRRIYVSGFINQKREVYNICYLEQTSCLTFILQLMTHKYNPLLPVHVLYLYNNILLDYFVSSVHT